MNISDYIFLLLGVLLMFGILFSAAYFCKRFNIGQQTPSQQTPSNSQPPAQALYPAYGMALMDCVAYIYQSIGLVKPVSLANHLLPPQAAIRFVRKQTYYVYVFDRAPSLSGGLKNIQYTTYPAAQMASKINAILPSYCIANGLAPVNVVAQKDIANGRVVFVIA